MLHHAPLITTIATGLVAAFVLGFLAQKVRLSPIVGYLAAGLVIGPYTPGFVGDVEIAAQLSEIGVILLMFGVGLHFSFRELLARMRAVMRRRGAASAESGPNGHLDDGESVLEVGPVRMDVERHTVAVGGQTVSLPLKEFDLLELLLRNAGRVLTRGQLIDRVWGADYVGDTKTLDVHVKRIRSKIEPDPSSPSLLLTVRGLGYKLADGES